MVRISCVVEGIIDEHVAKKLIIYSGGEPGPVYGKCGKSHIRSKIAGYCNASKFYPWLIIVDLNNEAECAPELRRNWNVPSLPLLGFCVAVREVEAWLLADRENIANFINIPIVKINYEPEKLQDPKEEIIRLARSSRRKDIREDIIPRPGSGICIGPAYSSRMIEFINEKWNIEEASKNSPSLKRAIQCLKHIVNYCHIP